MSRNGDLRLASINEGCLRLGPDALHLDLVNACNLACASCWDHSPLLLTPRPADWKRRRADTRVLLALLEDAMELGGLRSVVFSGQGEPMLHPDLGLLLREAERRGLRTALITNLLAGDPSLFGVTGPDELLVGVHAASAQTYAAFHPGCPTGAWDELLARLDALRTLGRRADKQVQVICSLNAHELAAMVRLCREHGCGRVTFKLASLGNGTEVLALSDELRERLRNEWLPEARMAAEELQVENNLDVLQIQLEDRSGGEAAVARVGCFMGWAYARVLVDGTVLFCCADDIDVGSLHEAPFRSLWQGPRWAELRTRLREGRYFPSCRRCGKLNQNVKLSRRFVELFGEARRRAVTGGGA